jgi:hypothetical protein
MKRIALCAVLCAAIVGCIVYTTSQYNAVKAKLQTLAVGECDVQQGLSDINRSYIAPCGFTATVACRRYTPMCDGKDFGYCGRFSWTIVDHWQYNAQGQLVPICTQGNGGSQCHWQGLTRDGGPDLHDCIVKWRTETCERSGWREGKGGKVVACDAVNKNILLPDGTWDWLDDPTDTDATD